MFWRSINSTSFVCNIVLTINYILIVWSHKNIIFFKKYCLAKGYKRLLFNTEDVASCPVFIQSVGLSIIGKR